MYWLPAPAWMALIFAGSTDLLSAARTAPFIVTLLRWLKPDLSDRALALAIRVIRKGGHLTEYAILAGLAPAAMNRSFQLLEHRTPHGSRDPTRRRLPQAERPQPRHPPHWLVGRSALEKSKERVEKRDSGSGLNGSVCPSLAFDNTHAEFDELVRVLHLMPKQV